MPYTVRMPAFGESVTESTVTRWLKRVGDHVGIDEPLVEVATDKVDTEVPSPRAGVLRRVLANKDETVEVGGALAVLEGESADLDDADKPAQAEGSAAVSESERVPRPGPASSAAGEAIRSGGDDAVERESSSSEAASGRWSGTSGEASSSAGTDVARRGFPYATPLVRKLAAERGMDLSAVVGTGVGGRIREEDVVGAVEERKDARMSAAASRSSSGDVLGVSAGRPTTTAGDGSSSEVHDAEVRRSEDSRSAVPPSAKSELRGTTRKMSRRRVTLARRMVESLHVSAQLTTVVEADLTPIAWLRDRAKTDFRRREGVKLTFLPFMALAAVEALKAHPCVNASVDTGEGEITYHGVEHLGIAVDTPSGLVVPVIRHAGDLGFGGLARKIADVADRARANELVPEELSGGTFTITNTGSRGALIDTPILNQPEVGVLGTGAVVKKASVVTDDEGGESIGIRSMAYLCLSYDHRVVDGADAARFLGTVKTRLEDGMFESDLGL